MRCEIYYWDDLWKCASAESRFANREHAEIKLKTHKVFASRAHVKTPHVKLQCLVTEFFLEIHLKSTLGFFHVNFNFLWKILALNSDLSLGSFEMHFPANIYLFKINSRNTRKRCNICTKLTNKNTRTKSMTSLWCLYR